MEEEKKEFEHIIEVLEQAKIALTEEDSLKLGQLSDQTIHSASIYQHTDFIMLAVIIYSLNKIMTRKTSLSNWKTFLKSTIKNLDTAISYIKQEDENRFVSTLEKIKISLTEISPEAKAFGEEVLKKASVNKAAKIHEHGISLDRTATLLDVTKWELLDYIGQKNLGDIAYSITIDPKRRAKMALEFFS